MDDDFDMPPADAMNEDFEMPDENPTVKVGEREGDREGRIEEEACQGRRRLGHS